MISAILLLSVFVGTYHFLLRGISEGYTSPPPNKTIEFIFSVFATITSLMAVAAVFLVIMIVVSETSITPSKIEIREYQLRGTFYDFTTDSYLLDISPEDKPRSEFRRVSADDVVFDDITDKVIIGEQVVDHWFWFFWKQSIGIESATLPQGS